LVNQEYNKVRFTLRFFICVVAIRNHNTHSYIKYRQSNL